MPLTFIEIERQKKWRIGIFFLILLFMYFCLALALVQVVFPVFSIRFFSAGLMSFDGNMHYLLILAAISLLVASIHFFFSAFGAVRSVIKALSASLPDPGDGIHERLINIMAEIHVVTGNKREINIFVIPSLSMNALAVADLKGDAAIMITEGLLSRLSRPQLEAVVAHEANHILSGDCIETTVAASLFGMYASIMEKLRGSGRGSGFPPLPVVLACVLLKLSQLLNMFISREREYRADAASVRMTRNPLALAEALHLLSRSWRGVGFIGNGLEMLCIVNPEATKRDELEGWWADLMSTHPPIGKRIDILLKMARVDVLELDKKAKKETAAPGAGAPIYYALDPKQQWQGPYSIADLALLPWFSPLTWISAGAEQSVDRAWRNPIADPIFTERLSQKEKEITAFVCPHCNHPLLATSYEKTQVSQCSFCGGILVENNKIPRILARREIPCTDRVKSLAKTIMKENQTNLTRKILKGGDKKKIQLMPCPKCKYPMSRVFYSLAYLVEIDRCGVCGITWFDTDELEMLQCLIENKITARIDLPQE